SGSQIGTEIQVLRRRLLAEVVVDSLGLQLVVERPKGAVRDRIFGGVVVDREAPESEYRFRRQEDGRFAAYRDGSDAPLGLYGIGELVRLDGAALRLLPEAAEHEEIRIAVLEFERALKY